MRHYTAFQSISASICSCAHRGESNLLTYVRFYHSYTLPDAYPFELPDNVQQLKLFFRFCFKRECNREKDREHMCYFFLCQNKNLGTF